MRRRRRETVNAAKNHGTQEIPSARLRNKKERGGSKSKTSNVDRAMKEEKTFFTQSAELKEHVREAAKATV